MSHPGKRRQLLLQLVEDMKLDNHAGLYKSGSLDIAVAIHEEDTRPIVLWATLKDFLKKHVYLFPTPADFWKDGISEEAIDDATSVVLDQGNFYLTQELIKRHLRQEEPVSLAELASFRYDKKKNLSSWLKYQKVLTAKIIPRAVALQMWEVETLRRQDSNSGGSIAGYKIRAGQALIDFDEYVFRPRRLGLHKSFYTRFKEWFAAKKEKLMASKMIAVTIIALAIGLVVMGYSVDALADIGVAKV